MPPYVTRQNEKGDLPRKERHPWNSKSIATAVQIIDWGHFSIVPLAAISMQGFIHADGGFHNQQCHHVKELAKHDFKLCNAFIALFRN